MGQEAGDLPVILIERGSFVTHCGYVGQDKAECSYRTPETPVTAQFKHIFERVLKVDPAQHKVVIVKVAGAPQQALQEEARILFTEFHVKACAFMNAQVGTIFSWVNQDTNGLVIDIGYESTRIVPIIDLVTQGNLLATIPMAGMALEHFLIEQLKNHGTPADIIERHREELIPYLMKEYCYFDAESELDFEREVIEARKLKPARHLTLQSMSEGPTDISLPSPVLPADLVKEKCHSHALAFSGEINKHVMKILEKLGADHHNTWQLGRIIITGGASHLLGLRSLLIRELVKAAHLKRLPGPASTSSSSVLAVEFQGVAFTIRSIPREDTPGSWVGASIAFSLNKAHEIFVSKETYHANSDTEFTLDHAVNSFC